VLLGTLTLLAIAAPWVSPYAPERQLDIVALRSTAPSWAHPFGTDSFSRDVLSRVLHGARISLGFAFATVLLGLVLGTAYGAFTSFAHRAVSTVLRRAIDVALSIPRLLVLLALTAFLGPLSVWQLVLLVGFTGWFATARQVTDELDGLQRREFTLAAQAMGVRTPRLFHKHLLPHLAPLLAVTGTFAVANTIALEAGLSFLGLGIQPPTASWGTILQDGAGSIESEWWITVFPGLATVGAVLLCNILGDALRDRFAPAHVAGVVTQLPGAIVGTARTSPSSDGRSMGDPEPSHRSAPRT
jgi:peptide/nickel transport system permease protein